MAGPTLTVTSDFTERFNEIIKKFKNDSVLVGIPADNTERKPDADGKMPAINNATLLALANFGSPMNNIPAWPIMQLGITRAQAAITEQFKLAAKRGLTIGFEAVDQAYERAGIIASTSIKKVINDQEGVPPGRPNEGTLDSRKRAGFKGQKYWLVTGQMRNAITYVIKGKE